MESIPAPSKPDPQQAPEWAMKAAHAIWERATTYPCEMREWQEVAWEQPSRVHVVNYMANAIAQHLDPAVKELVEAAMQLLASIDTPADEHTQAFVDAVRRTLFALKPFKEGE